MSVYKKKSNGKKYQERPTKGQEKIVVYDNRFPIDGTFKSEKIIYNSYTLGIIYINKNH